MSGWAVDRSASSRARPSPPGTRHPSPVTLHSLLTAPPAAQEVLDVLDQAAAAARGAGGAARAAEALAVLLVLVVLLVVLRLQLADVGGRLRVVRDRLVDLGDEGLGLVRQLAQVEGEVEQPVEAAQDAELHLRVGRGGEVVGRVAPEAGAGDAGAAAGGLQHPDAPVGPLLSTAGGGGGGGGGAGGEVEVARLVVPA